MLGSLVNSELEGMWKEAVLEFTDTRLEGQGNQVSRPRSEPALSECKSPANMPGLKRLDAAKQAA
jgi:hypothetical protein